MSGPPPPAALSGQPQVNTSSIFPLPPMRYINLFTDDNVATKSCPQPPKPVTEGQYSMFGQTIAMDDQIIRSLESQGLKRLYPRDYDHRRELKKMNASILVNFLDLLDVLVRCPETEKREIKTNDIQLLFITMHHLINELRPHQARESIRVMIQSQKRQRFETSARLSKQIDRVIDLVNTAINSIADDTINETLDLKPDINRNTLVTKCNDLDNSMGDSIGSEVDNTYEKDALMCDFVEELAFS
ncbi:mediator of RNA polymerase II transcription subunit 7-like [Oppia nitens]|uniref:mediator of RNA polymerase II transcription subunit 7-like n=1 Tax=Oppia nitens TaxID=1686743 RepID=UPI0023DBB5F8|nr:mediator of RNA polymerase II transcription subunit 7-like [Oppia nitens]